MTEGSEKEGLLRVLVGESEIGDWRVVRILGPEHFEWQKERCEAKFLRERCEAEFLKERCEAEFVRERCEAEFVRQRCEAEFLKEHCEAEFVRERCEAEFLKERCEAEFLRELDLNELESKLGFWAIASLEFEKKHKN